MQRRPRGTVKGRADQGGKQPPPRGHQRRAERSRGSLQRCVDPAAQVPRQLPAGGSRPPQGGTPPRARQAPPDDDPLQGSRGVVSPDAYLAHDRIAERWGNGTMRLTTRQDFQLHGVLKGDLRAAIREINQALLTTLGGCGDVERNIMCCPAPVVDGFRAEVAHWLAALVAELTPSTGAYHEIWLDGEPAVQSLDTQAEPLY